MDNYVGTTDGKATSFVGPDAVELFRAVTLKSGIALHRKCKMIPTRGLTITRMFELASKYTGKKYKRNQHEQAEADLQAWINTMKAALPVVENKQ